MAFADWFRPKWKHSNPVVRTAAVKATTDQAILGQVATNDADANVRIAAVEALTDEKVLCEVAKGDTDDKTRSAALARVSGDAALAEIVQRGRSGDTRMAALARLSEPALLGEVAKGNDDAALRKAATLRVTDTSVLVEVVKRDADASVRQAAIDRIDISLVTDDFVLGELAKKRERPEARKAATAKINDSALLMEIAEGTEDSELRALALRRVTDQPMLAAAVIAGCKFDLEITNLITDQTQLSRIAKTAKDKNCRQKAVARVEDEAVLAEVANTDVKAAVRAQASKRLDPLRWKDLLAVLNAKVSTVTAAKPAVLAEIARKATDETVRSAAVMRLVDGSVLAQVAEKDAHPSVRSDAQKRIAVLEREQRVAQGNASCEDLRDIGAYYQVEDPRKCIRFCTEAVSHASWLRGLAWQDRMALFETRAAANLATKQYDAAIDDFERAIEECKEPGYDHRVLRKRAACYKEMGMDEQAQADRAAAARAEQHLEASRRAT
jgi:tetratricopeptide (TPR) repeat protein